MFYRIKLYLCLKYFSAKNVRGRGNRFEISYQQYIQYYWYVSRNTPLIYQMSHKHWKCNYILNWNLIESNCTFASNIFKQKMLGVGLMDLKYLINNTFNIIDICLEIFLLYLKCHTNIENTNIYLIDIL